MADVAVPTRGRSRTRSPANHISAPASWAAPALAWYAVFMVGPLIAMFYLSLQKWATFAAPRSYAGFANFRKVFSDAIFYTAIRNSAFQLALEVPLIIVLAFMLGYYLTLNPRGHAVLRFLFFTPALISMPAKAMIFLTVFSPPGLVNGLLDAVGLNAATRAWLANAQTALPVVIAIDMWSGIGFTAILFSARMAGIPRELYEAAAVDGASHWVRMWRVAYPLAKDYVGVLTMLQFFSTLFASAGTILLLTKGGPAGATTTLSYLVYQRAFIQFDIGYSQAVAIVLFFVGLVGMIVIRRAFRQTY